MKQSGLLSKLIVAVIAIALMLEGIYMPYNTKGASADSSTNKNNFFNAENYTLTLNYNVEANWDDFYNISVSITNQTGCNLKNWAFFLPLDGKIVSIWNATFEEAQQDFYIINNAGWNQEINHNETVSFGMIVKSNDIAKLSQTVFLSGEYNEVKIDASIEQDDTWYYIKHGTVLDVLNASNMTRYSFMFYDDGSCMERIYNNYEVLLEEHFFSANGDSAENDNNMASPQLRALSPGKKIYDGWKRNYYYQKINDSIYYYVGCNKRYLIKNSGNSAEALHKYRNSIDATRKYKDKVDKSCLKYGISVSVAVPLVMVNIALPETVVVDILLASINKVGVAALQGIVSNCYKNYKEYKKVKKYFKEVKKYAR